ncbi:MAG: CPBP family intramembrane metalloprotease [Candidatus Hydrogenedentes bacterium]|nr:CPBP family intramembrane metalloprotease [Candidatus Hydrogenedentota bacterium]
MNLRIVIIIFRKEILDMLRDKRTLIAMLGLPLILYPALFIVGAQLALMQQDKVAGARSLVAVAGAHKDILEGWLLKTPKMGVAISDDPELDLAEGRLQAIVSLESDPAKTLELGKTANILIRYDATDTSSQEAVKRIMEALDAREKEMLKSRLELIGIPGDFVNPYDIERRNVASGAKYTGTVLGMLMPLIMIVMLGVGAFYPAINLTAGEKERGTFETLLSTPISSFDILGGKFLAVFVLAMLTGLTNLASMVGTFAFQLSQMQDSASVSEIHIPAYSVLVIVLALIPLAFFISAVMMSIAVYAKSFQEAQSLLTPFLLILLFPAALAAIPGFHLSVTMQLVPIANFALLFKDLVTQKVSAHPIVMVLLSTTVYACLALYMAARIFRREDVVLSHDHGLSLTLRRSQFIKRDVPTPGTALFIFTLCLLLLFYAGTYVQGKYALWGLVITQYGIFLFPTVLVLWYLRVNLRSALSLRLPQRSGFFGGLVIALGWAVMSLQLSVWQQRILPFPEELAKEMERLTGLGDQPVWVLLLVLALSPAICEETLFRGAVLSGLRKYLPWWALLLAVGVAFGVAHISIHRMFLTGLSGVMLTYVVWRTGSIYPGILAHFVINSTAVLLQNKQVEARMPEELRLFLDAALKQEQGFPWWVLVGAAMVFAIGIVLTERSRPKASSTSPA